MPDDQEQRQSSDGPSDTHQIRFIARTLDGVEVKSAPINLAPGEGASQQARVATAYWGHAQYGPGDKAYACANAFNAEGAVVKFVIEKSSGGGWSALANLRAKVKNDEATTTWHVPNSLAKGTKVRFRAKTALNEQTAPEFTIGAGEEKQADEKKPDEKKADDEKGAEKKADAPKGDKGASGGGTPPSEKPAPAQDKPPAPTQQSKPPPPRQGKPPPPTQGKPPPGKPAPAQGKPPPAQGKPAPHAGGH